MGKVTMPNPTQTETLDREDKSPVPYEQRDFEYEARVYAILYKHSRLSDGVRCINEDEWPTELLAQALTAQKTAFREQVEGMRVNLMEVEKSINESFYKRVLQMKKVKVEKNWPHDKWNTWHSDLLRRRGQALRTSRAAIKAKNKALDDVLSKLEESEKE